MNMFNGNLAPGGALKVAPARRRQVRGTAIRRSSPLSLRAKSRSQAAPQVVPVGQAFQPADAPDFPVRCSAAPGDWKAARAGRLESLPYVGSAAPVPETSRAGRVEQDSLFAMYVREVGQVALLTPAEEIALAARIHRGDAAAREHMIRANLRLVIKIAREYENLGMPLLDRINEGNVGLMKAVEKFDPAKGGKLSTYAALWIRQQIRRALASQGKTIRLPVHVADRIYHLSQAELRLRVQLGRDATDAELAQELNTTVLKLGRLRRAAARPASLDAPLGEDASSTIAEVVADENAATPFEQLQTQTETALVRKLVANLPEREARILRLRFGLDSGPEQTLETVGRKLKLTRERIRQVQNLALQKLRQMLENPKHFPVAT
jgi:RNA polymerase primary sigma factor